LLKLLLPGSGCADCFCFARAATMNVGLLFLLTAHTSTSEVADQVDVQTKLKTVALYFNICDGE
jgi:hypothetical protein